MKLLRAAPWVLTVILTVWTGVIYARYRPPFADLPQHAWTLTMLRHPEVYADAFVVTFQPWRTNTLWFTLDGALAGLLTPDQSLALACALATVTLPLALAGWAHALGRSAGLALVLGWWVTWHRTLYWGFVNYDLSLVLGIGVLALDAAIQRTGTGRWRLVACVGLLTLTWLAHAQTWLFILGVLALQRGAFALAGLGDPRPWPRRLAATLGQLSLLTLPSLTLFVPYAALELLSPHASEAPLASVVGGLKPRYHEASVAFEFLIINATAAVKWTTADDLLAKALLWAGAVGLLGGMWRSRGVERAWLLVPFAVGCAGLAAYLYAPLHVLGQFQIASRMAPWVLLVAVPLASPRLPRWGAVVALAAAMVGAVESQRINALTFQGYAVESAPVFAILDKMAPGKRATLWADHLTSRQAYGSVYGHVVAWYAAETLGRSDFSFAEFRPNPVVYRDPLHYPRAVAGEETKPWCATLSGDGIDFDYVVTRGDQKPGAACGSVALYADVLREVAREKDWALYEVTRPMPRRRPKECVCRGRPPRVGPPQVP